MRLYRFYCQYIPQHLQRSIGMAIQRQNLYPFRNHSMPLHRSDSQFKITRAILGKCQCIYSRHIRYRSLLHFQGTIGYKR